MSRKGIPLIEDRDAVLSERVTVKMTPDNRRGLQWLIAQRLAAAGGPDSGLELTEAAFLRTLLTRELRAAGWPGATPAAATPAADDRGEPIVGWKGIAAHLHAREPGAAPPVTTAAPVASQAAQTGSAGPATTTASTPAPDSPEAVRALLEACLGPDLSISALASRSGIDRAALSHFKNRHPERGTLSADKVRTLGAALRRWQKEQGA